MIKLEQCMHTFLSFVTIFWCILSAFLFNCNYFVRCFLFRAKIQAVSISKMVMDFFGMSTWGSFGVYIFPFFDDFSQLVCNFLNKHVSFQSFQAWWNSDQLKLIMSILMLSFSASYMDTLVNIFFSLLITVTVIKSPLQHSVEFYILW